ncbi:MAG: ATP-binding protein [Pseudomonadota bacterium]
MNLPRLWLPRAAPMHLMLGAMVLVLIQCLAAVEWQRQQPFFDLPLRLHQGQIQLQSTPADTPLPIQSIQLAGQILPLPPEFLMPDPDYFASYADLNGFLARQQQLHNLLQQTQVVTLLATDGSRHSFERQPKSLLQMPVEFWIYQAFGGLALLVGTAFWAFHRGQPATRILALAGFGFALMEWTMSLYATRELALAETGFRLLLALNHFGGMLFASSTIGLLMFQPVSQPRSQSGSRPLSWLLWAGGLGNLLCLGNEILQGMEWPGNIFYFPTLLLLPAFIALAARQYQLTRGKPQLRSQLRWLVSTLTGGLGLAFILYVVPLLLTQTSWLTLLQANIIVLLVFLGFVLGAQRSELFGIHRWWLRSWIVSGALLVLVLADVSALLTFHQAGLELGLLAFALSWLYLPLRQWCWHRVLALFRPAATVSHPGLRVVLTRFNPLHLQWCAQPPAALETQQGLVLAVPVAGNQWVILTGKSRGFALFSPQDAALALELVKSADASQPDQLLHQSLQKERERIMRDLHDDVAADLLTLLHQAEDEPRRHLVRETLGNLRAIIYSLQPGQTRTLRELGRVWQEDCLRRCRAANVDATWLQADDSNDIAVNPAQALQLQRMLREAVSNALRHARPQQIRVDIRVDRHHLLLEVCDNGAHQPLHLWRPGKGLHNLRQRAQELNGQARWQLRRENGVQVCAFSARIPLHEFAITPATVTRRHPHAEHLAA